MNLSKLAPLTVALLCITAIGVSATTLETSLSTDPDEAIDTYEILPIGQEDAAALQQEFEGDADASGQGGDSDDASSSQSDNQQSAAGQSDNDQSTSQQEAMGAAPAEPSLLDRLLAFLLSILRFLLAVAVIVGLSAIAYRYRDRILAVLRSLLGSDDDGAAEATAGRSWPHGDPSNVVERAWLKLVQRVDPERPSVMTPAECAAAARRAGLDAGPVETITGAFERVEYGGVPPADEADRVKSAWREIDKSAPRDGDAIRSDGGDREAGRDPGPGRDRDRDRDRDDTGGER